MPAPTYDITCIKNVNITQSVHEVRFSKPKGFSFQAGQFVLFHVPLVGDPADVQTRAYSIASAPHEEELLFIIKVKEGGRASNWVSSLLGEGDTVRMQGPFGRFLLEEGRSDLLMICTGTGIAPFRSQVWTLSKNKSNRRVFLFFGNLTEKDLFWKEELEAIEAEHDWFAFHPVLRDADEGWRGHRGFVQDAITATVQDIPGKDLYICGSPVMADAVKKLALGEWGVARDRVHVEGFV